jgi:O-antigen ligase
MLPAQTVKTSPSNVASKGIPFYLVLICLAWEFARPQDALSVLGMFRFPMISNILMGLAIILSGRFPLSHRPTQLFLALLGLLALHIPIAANNYLAFDATYIMVLIFAMYLGIVVFVDSDAKMGTLIRVWLGIHLFLALMGLRSGGRGIGGFLGDENDFAMTLNMIIPFPFFLAFSTSKKSTKLIYLALLCLFLFVNMLTLSRGGFLGLAAVAAYCWLRSPRKIASAALIALLAALMIYVAPEDYGAEIRSIWEQGADEGTTGEDRLYIWGIAWEMFLDNPVLGVGGQNLIARFADYEGDRRLHGVTRVWRAAHSLYFTLFPELGLLGIGIFFALVYYTLRDLRLVRRALARNPQPHGIQRRRESEGTGVSLYHLALAMEGSLVSFLVTSAFISTLYYPNFWVMMGFVMALRRVVESRSKGDPVLR